MEGCRVLVGSRAGLFGCRHCNDWWTCPEHRHLELRQLCVSASDVSTIRNLALAQHHSHPCL